MAAGRLDRHDVGAELREQEPGERAALVGEIGHAVALEHGPPG
jgi:hypothetical protein